jgi:putative transposase
MKLENLRRSQEKLQKEICLEQKKKKRKRMRKALKRLSIRISKLVDAFHHNMANFLTENYDIILCPKFNTSNMMKSTGMKIINELKSLFILHFCVYILNSFLSFIL